MCKVRVKQLGTELWRLRILARVKGMNLVAPFGADGGILWQFSYFSGLSEECASLEG